MRKELKALSDREGSIVEEESMAGFDSSLIPVLGILTGIVAILTPVAIVFIIFHFRHLRYIQRQQTIRMAIEKGVDLSPFLIAGDGPAADPHPGDPHSYVLPGLLWGIPGVAIGLGVTWAAIQHGPRGITIIGWIPAAIGAAYLIFSRFAASHDRDAARPDDPPPPATRPSGIPRVDPRKTE
jgi:Domain of unknown function (DUF6249)